MQLKKAAAAAVAAALVAAVPAAAQPTGDRGRALTILEGPGSRIGAAARDLDAEEAARLKVAGGVLVERVDADGPAAKAGLRAQDVVVEFDRERVRSLRQFTRLVRETPPDRPVPAVVLRDGRRTEITVTPTADRSAMLSFDPGRLRDQIGDLTERIRPFESAARVLMPRARLGANVQELTPELAEFFGAPGGVLVAAVTAGSPAGLSGLRAGDVITAVNGRRVGSSADLIRELGTVGADGTITLDIVRDKKPSTLTAKVETPTPRRLAPGRPI